MKRTLAALLFAASLDAYAVNIPVIDMADICTRYHQGDPVGIAQYNALKDGQSGIDPVKTCADFKASEALEVPGPEETARSFMAQIANVEPGRVGVTLDIQGEKSAVATATAPGGKRCLFSLSAPPVGVRGWLVGALECSRSGGGGGIPVLDMNAVEKAKQDAGK